MHTTHVTHSRELATPHVRGRARFETDEVGSMRGVNEQGNADERRPAAAAETSAPQNTCALEHERHRSKCITESFATAFNGNGGCAQEKPVKSK